jgi:hypothetical protein
MLYLLRHVETGRDAQPQRRKQQRDIVAELSARVFDARIWTETGRVFLDSAADATGVLAELHGIVSFSPCGQCALATLSAYVIEQFAAALAQAHTFALRIKRVGLGSPSSREVATSLGRAIQERFPGLRVDLDAPDVGIGVEIRGETAYVFVAVVPGLDHRGSVAAPAGELRFLADQMLGRLAAWLRLLGCDTAQFPDQADSLLLRKARAEARILLTRDHELAQARSASVVFLASEGVDEQLRELAHALGLRFRRAQMFSRCTLCNRLLEPRSKAAVASRVPLGVRGTQEQFFYCPDCDKLYWPGDHHARILARLEGLLD